MLNKKEIFLLILLILQVMIHKRGDYMIKSNLKVILAENNLRVSKVANDTGISRTTLTALSENHSKGIQLDTMNKLCKYLKILPSDLFVYAPVDINPKVFDIKVLGYKKNATDEQNIQSIEIHCSLFLNINTGIEKFSEEFNAIGKLANDGDELFNRIIFNFKPVDDTATQLKVKNIIDGLPILLRNSLFEQIRETISLELDKASQGIHPIEWAQILDWPTVNIDFIPW